MSTSMKFSNVNVDQIVYNKTPKSREDEKHPYVGMFYPKKDQENKYGKLAFFTPKLQCSLTDNYVHFFIPANDKKDPFFKFLLQVDQMNVHTASENSELWFGEKLTDDEVQEKYKYSVKVGDMTQHGRVFSAKIKRDENNEHLVKVFNNLKDKCELGSCSGKQVVALVELERLVFSKHTYKAEWNVHQLKVYEPEPPTEEKEETPTDEPETIKPPVKAAAEFDETFSNMNDEVLDYDDDSD